MKHELSKDDIIKGVQCPKKLWLSKNRPELVPESRNYHHPEHLKLSKEEIKKFTRELFPQAVLPQSSHLSGMLLETKELIKANHPVIANPVFKYKKIISPSDYLVSTPKGYQLYEIKSATGYKPIHLVDLALQDYVLKGNSIPISDIFIVTINNKYEREKELDTKELLVIKNITGEARGKYNYIKKQILALDKLLSKTEPKTPIGLYCENPSPCPFHSYCWKNVPAHSILNLTKMEKKQRFALFHEGIRELTALPREIMEELSEKQQIQIESLKNNTPYILYPKLEQFLNSLSFPLYFLDFETYQSPIPHFEGTKPFSQIPFQFSLHILKNPDSPLLHEEFQADPGGDPRPSFIEALLSKIPEDACVLAYNGGFEKGVIKKLSKNFPDYKDPLLSLHNRIRDLLIPFKNFYYYNNAMRGSHSLKHVLPALLPEYNYGHLDIARGEDAANAYFHLNHTQDLHEQSKIRKALLDYCHMDTLAMVKIWEFLNGIVHENSKRELNRC